MLRVTRRTKPPLAVLVAPLPTRLAPATALAPALALVLSTGPADGPVLAEPALQQLFGLTMAEAGVALALAAGRSAEEIAGARGVGLPTVRTEVDHHRPLRYTDEVELESEVVRVGSTSVEWRHRFWLAGESRPACECRVVTVLVEMGAFEKRPVPDWLREKLRPHI